MTSECLLVVMLSLCFYGLFSGLTNTHTQTYNRTTQNMFEHQSYEYFIELCQLTVCRIGGWMGGGKQKFNSNWLTIDWACSTCFIHLRRHLQPQSLFLSFFSLYFLAVYVALCYSSLFYLLKFWLFFFCCFCISKCNAESYSISNFVIKLTFSHTDTQKKRERI